MAADIECDVPECPREATTGAGDKFLCDVHGDRVSRDGVATCRHCGATDPCICTDPNAEGLHFVTGKGTCWTPPTDKVNR